MGYDEVWIKIRSGVRMGSWVRTDSEHLLREFRFASMMDPRWIMISFPDLWISMFQDVENTDIWIWGLLYCHKSWDLIWNGFIWFGMSSY